MAPTKRESEIKGWIENLSFNIHNRFDAYLSLDMISKLHNKLVENYRNTTILRFFFLAHQLRLIPLGNICDSFWLAITLSLKSSQIGVSNFTDKLPPLLSSLLDLCRLKFVVKRECLLTKSYPILRLHGLLCSPTTSSVFPHNFSHACVGTTT